MSFAHGQNATILYTAIVLVNGTASDNVHRVLSQGSTRLSTTRPLPYLSFKFPPSFFKFLLKKSLSRIVLTSGTKPTTAGDHCPAVLTRTRTIYGNNTSKNSNICQLRWSLYVKQKAYVHGYAECAHNVSFLLPLDPPRSRRMTECYGYGLTNGFELPPK